MIVDITLVFVSQFGLIFSKHYNVKTIIDNNPQKAAVTAVVIQVMWLVSSGLGIKGMLEGNWIIITAYIVAGYLGSLASFEIRKDKYKRIIARRKQSL